MIGLTAGLFGLSPYEATRKLIADFQLPLTAEKRRERRKKIQKQESGFCQREDDRLAPACGKNSD